MTTEMKISVVTYDEECSSVRARRPLVAGSVVGSAWYRCVLGPRAVPAPSWDRWCCVRPARAVPAAAAAAEPADHSDADELQASLIIHTVQCNAMQGNAALCNAIQCSAVQCSAVQCSAMQCSAMQCNAVQCNAMQWVSRTQAEGLYFRLYI